MTLSYWKKKKKDIFNALDLIDDVLEVYDEDCGFGFDNTVPVAYETLCKFFRELEQEFNRIAGRI